MVNSYNDFLNEAARIAELISGSTVILKGKRVFSKDKGYLDIDGKIAKVSKNQKIKNNDSCRRFLQLFHGGYHTEVTFELQDPIPPKDKRGKPITHIRLLGTQLRGIELLTGDYVEIKKKLESGELAEFKATKDTLRVFKNIKFNPVGKYFDISYLDLVKENPDMISFIPAKKSKGEDFEKFKQTTRAGRVFRKLNPNLKDIEIEALVNRFRAESEANFIVPKIDVLTGKDIPYWYDEVRYQRGGGSLNNSCMRGSSAQSRVAFYGQHPDRIAMAAIIKNDKLRARAIIWRCDDGRIYMDRIYCVDGKSGVQLEKYAKANNMSCYRHADGLNKQPRMQVTLPNGKSKNYPNTPYMDTMYCAKIEADITKVGHYNLILMSNYGK